MSEETEEVLRENGFMPLNTLGIPEDEIKFLGNCHILGGKWDDGARALIVVKRG